MSQSSDHLKLGSGPSHEADCTPVASTVTRSQSSRAAFGRGGGEASRHRSSDVNMVQTSEGHFQHLLERVS